METRPPVIGRWVAISLVALLLAGCVAPVVPRPPEIAARAATLTAQETSNLRVFDTAWDLVNRKFYDPKFRGVNWKTAALTYGPKALVATDDDQLFGVLNAMLGELKESHNWARTPKEAAEKPERPLARIGMAVGRLEDRWIVIGVLPDSPAEEAGVRVGWVFVSRNGRTLGTDEEFSLQDGERVNDVFLDAQDVRRSLTIVARPLSIVAWRHTKELAGGVVYLRFDAFDWASCRWLSAQLKEHRGAPAVIVDLRQNPGGVSVPLSFTIGEFFPKSMPWGKFTGRSGRQFDEDSWQWGSARYEGRVAVLVSGSTASCAEIFARALQYYHRALIVGRQTAGAVIGSAFFSLPGGGKLQLGVIDYHGLDGQRLEGVGVKPDVSVAASFESIEDLRAGRDRDIEAALGALKANGVRAPENRTAGQQ